MYTKKFPRYGFIALALCLLAWTCSWLHIDPFYRYAFFPLWLGYILFVDALVVARHSTSLVRRMGARIVLLFLLSSVFWWIFEGLNAPVQNWHYILDQPYSPFAYFLLSSLSFSTVLPAVMETAELLSTFKRLHPRLSADNPGPQLKIHTFIFIEITGIACLILPFIFPHYCFVLVWLSVVLILDPVNNMVGRKSAFAHILVGDWRFFILPLAGIICGFFWEMWNFFALPKWYYTIPFVGFWKIFEMPLLGYLGYLPFALELFALYQFVLFVTRQKNDYLVI